MAALQQEWLSLQESGARACWICQKQWATKNTPTLLPNNCRFGGACGRRAVERVQRLNSQVFAVEQ